MRAYSKDAEASHRCELSAVGEWGAPRPNRNLWSQNENFPSRLGLSCPLHVMTHLKAVAD